LATWYSSWNHVISNLLLFNSYLIKASHLLSSYKYDTVSFPVKCTVSPVSGSSSHTSLLIILVPFPLFLHLYPPSSIWLNLLPWSCSQQVLLKHW
jgi:hypothetical protein